MARRTTVEIRMAYQRVQDILGVIRHQKVELAERECRIRMDLEELQRECPHDNEIPGTRLCQDCGAEISPAGTR